MANQSISFLTYEFLILLFIILSIIFEKVNSFDFLDLSRSFNPNIREKELNDVSFCYWINLDLRNIKQEIFQIDQISSKFKIENYDNNANSTTYLNFSSYSFPEELYRDCGINRFCGLLRWDEVSKNFLYELIMHKSTPNRLDNFTVNVKMQFDKPSGINWIYFCQNIFLKQMIPDSKQAINDTSSKGPLVKISTYKTIPKFFCRLKIEIRKDLFHTNADFNQLNFNSKIKNTKNFFRANNIKVFYDIDNFDKIRSLILNSIFFDTFPNIKEFNYKLLSFNELTDNKIIDYNFDDKSTYLQPVDLDRINSLPEFDFPKIFNHFEYTFNNKVLENLYSNYIDSEIRFNITNYLKTITFKYQSFINNISNGSFISYLINDFSFNEDTKALLDNLLKNEASMRPDQKAKVIEFIIFAHGKFVLTNSLGESEIKNTILDPNNIVLAEPTNRFEYTLVNPIIKIPIDQLNSAKYLIFELRDYQGKPLFYDFDINYFNDLPLKIIETPSPNIMNPIQNVIDQSQVFTNDLSTNLNTLVNCFWINTRNYFTEKAGENLVFKIGFDLSTSFIPPLKKVSLNSNFLIINKKIEDFKYSCYNNIKKIETNWNFLNHFNSSSNSVDFKTNFFNKEWNHFCSFTNMNNNFESNVFMNNHFLFKVQEKFIDEFASFKHLDLRLNITNTNILLGDFKINLISLQDPANLPNLYFTYKYNGIHNSFESLFYHNLTWNLRDRLTVLKPDCIKRVESNEYTYLNKFIYFNSLEPDFTQLFINGYPKTERIDDKFSKFKIRFNPDLIFKLFLKNNSTSDFMFGLLQNFKLLKENAVNNFINNSTYLLYSLQEDSNLVLSEYAIRIVLDNRSIQLGKGDLLNENFFIIENMDGKFSFTPQTISLQIYEPRFNICIFSQRYNFFDFFNTFKDDYYLTSDRSIFYSLDSTSLINPNNLEYSGSAGNVGWELNKKINNLENYNQLRSRIFYSTFYFDNTALNFTNINLKTDKFTCFKTEIRYSLFDTQIMNMKPHSLFETYKDQNHDLTTISINKEYFPHNTLIKKYTQFQLRTLYIEDFSNYILETKIKYDEFSDKNINSLTNKFSFYTNVFQFSEKSTSNVETNSLNFFKLSTDSSCGDTKDFNPRVSNKASFLNFDKLINIHLDSNILNIKNLKWSEDEMIRSLSFTTGKEKLIFTIENNLDNTYKMLSSYEFDDNINELKTEFSDDLEFLKVLDNIIVKINLLREYKNRLSFYSLHFEYKNKTIIDSLSYNEYFFVNIKEIGEETIQKYPDQYKTKADILNYLEKSPDNKKTKLKIKIFFERFNYKAYSYHSMDENKIYYYYSLENLFQPLFFSIDKLSMTIKKFFGIVGEIDKIVQINNMNKFQFSNITIEEYSPRFISVCFHDINNYSNNHYDIDVLYAISGVIHKDNKRISDIDLIPFYNYRKNNIIPLLSNCQEEKIILYSRTNYRYMENNILKDLRFSVYESYFSFFIHPACFNIIKAIYLYDNINKKINQSFNQTRRYFIIMIDPISTYNLDFDLIDGRKIRIKSFKESISLKSPYIVQQRNSLIIPDYSFVIFNKNQDLKFKLAYEISNKRYLSRVINTNNYQISFSNCKDKLNFIDTDNVFIKYYNPTYSSCHGSFFFLDQYVNSFNFRFFNFENFLEIRATQQEDKILNNIELSIKSLEEIKIFGIVKHMYCSKKMFILAKKEAKINNLDGFKSFNFNEIISDANKKILENKEISKYNYQINFENQVANTTDFLYLVPSKIKLPTPPLNYLLNFKIFENKTILQKVLDDLFKEVEYYDLSFIYSYVSCKICLANDFCDYSNSNVLEFNNPNFIINSTKPSNDTNKTNNETIIDLNNKTDSNGSKSNNNSTENNSTYLNKNATNNTIPNEIKNNSIVIEDLNKNATNNTILNDTKNNSIVIEDLHKNVTNNTILNDTKNNSIVIEDLHKNATNNTILNDTKNNSIIIEDLEKNSTNSQSSSTLIVMNFNKTNNIISSSSLINQIQSGAANISTIPLANFTLVNDTKARIDIIKSNGEMLEKLDKTDTNPKQDLIKETINVNLILSKINCSNTSNNIREDCRTTKEYAQERILMILNKTFDCNKIIEAISNDNNNSQVLNINYLLDRENFINSLASVYISSMNQDSFSDKNIKLINDINNCLLEYGPDLLKKINIVKDYNSSKPENKSGSIENDFLKMISITSSNMINIAINSNKKEIEKQYYNATEVNDLIIKNENLDIKKTVEKNSLMFVKLNRKIFNIEQENSTANNTDNPNQKVDQIKLLTDNLVFYSKKAISRKPIPFESNNHNHKQKLRYLGEPEYEFLYLNEFGMDIKIRLPIYYLRNVYNKNLSSYSLIFYNKYPLLSPNGTNINDKVMSLKLLDHNLNEIPVFNLTTPIQIFIKRSKKMMSLKKCVFFDEEITNWNTTGCETAEIGDYIVCSCNHLTDFSLGKYDPIRLFIDLKNLILDSWIINDFKVFQKLNFRNAYMVYVFLIILIIYAYALRNAIKRDLRDENDPFVFQIEEEPKFCSNVEILKKIELIKELVDTNEDERKVTALKILQFKIESSLSEKKEILINNGMFIDNETNSDKKLNSNQSNLDDSSNSKVLDGDQVSKNKEAPIFSNHNENILGERPMRTNFLKGLLKRILKKKEGSLEEQTSDDFNNGKEIELQKIQNVESKENSSKEENKKEKDFVEIEINKKNEDRAGTDNAPSVKVLIDGLKIKISNEIVDHKNFIMHLYNDDNQELKQEIDKFFLIERINSFKSIDSSTVDVPYSENEIKRNSINVEGTDIEKANSNNFKDESTLTNSNLNCDINKISFLSSVSTRKNTISVKERNNEDKINDDYFDNSFDNPSFRKKSTNRLIEKTSNNLNPETVEVEDDIQVRIKNYKIIRYIQVLKHIFVNNYRLLCLILSSEMLFSKTNFLTLIFTRIIATLGVGTMLSLRFNVIENVSSKGYKFNNRELAVSITTILLIEIILTVVEVLLKKSKVYKNSNVEEKYKIRNKAKITVIITYILIFFTSLFFIINTIWITLMRATRKNDKNDKFIIQFFLSLFLDFFVKEVIVLTAKAYIFFLLIETKEDRKWKNYMISILALAE